MLDTLRNTYGFFSLYANIDGYDPAEHFAPLSRGRPSTDVDHLATVTRPSPTSRPSMDGYDITKAVRKLQQFVLEDLSNWYVRLSRARFWKGEMDEDKKAAYSTLHEVLLATVTRDGAVRTVPVRDAIYRQASRGRSGDAPSSVHLCRLSRRSDGGAIDAELESVDGDAPVRSWCWAARRATRRT